MNNFKQILSEKLKAQNISYEFFGNRFEFENVVVYFGTDGELTAIYVNGTRLFLDESEVLKGIK